MKEISAQTGILLALSMLKGVGPSTLRKVSRIPNFHLLPIEELAAHVPALAKALQQESSWSSALESAARQLDQADRYMGQVISPFDAEYPRLLTKTKDDPFLLFVRGSLFNVPDRSVAIIGTREPTTHGQEAAARLARYFGEQGWSIVSGLALGCDGIAHKAAVESGAHTVAVLAHGLHTIAPSRHRKLADEILESGGALVSQYPFGQGALPQQFVQRDRVQAGLAQGVVMVQSDIKGGSLHASRAAIEYERPLIVPYPTSTDRQNEEPKIQANLLIAEGADFARADLLRCHTSALEKVVVVRGKDEYGTMVERLSSAPALAAAHQPALV
jgi:DNA processing protein